MKNIQEGLTLWLTGLSGTGKSTLAQLTARRLREQGYAKVIVLDSDLVWSTDSKKQFILSRKERESLLRSIGIIADLMTRIGTIVIVAALNPYREVRKEIRRHHKAPFVLGYLEAEHEVLIQRDVKGQFAKILAGEEQLLADLAEVHEKPLEPDLHLQTDELTVVESVREILTFLEIHLDIEVLPKTTTTVSLQEAAVI